MENENMTPEEELKAENELLRLKLAMEHGMQQSETNLPPEVENEWLNDVYNFEQQYKDAKRIKLMILSAGEQYHRAERFNRLT